MATVSVRYLQAIDGYLHYRRRVPQDLKAVVGKSEWVHGLGLTVGQEEQAIRIISDYNAAYARHIAQTRIQKLSGGMAPELLAPTGQPVLNAGNSPQNATPVVKFSEAYAYDLEAHGGQRNGRAVMQSVDSFLNEFGDADILSLTPKDVQQWINACLAKGQKASTVECH